MLCGAARNRGGNLVETHSSPPESQELSLADAAKALLEECRMVLPGIQALFGFQLVVVFSGEFAIKLDASGQRLHWFAIALIAVAIAMIMTPASLHRLRGGRRVDDQFLRVAGRLLLWSMFPLALAISLDLYLIGTLILGPGPALATAAGLCALFLFLWFLLPLALKPRDRNARRP